MRLHLVELKRGLAMEQLKKDKLCYYCYGCNKLETDFEGVSRCKDFVSAVADYQEKIREELKKIK